ncbi:DUF4349 domain-containing protein [Mucilaginibacter sp. BJC16-A38]|uniref:DUF4349 domain-containing protein n=1 Tax=Mucilaginibacter phenanthrenivorans TaxID=1234842 RepID=UPI0021584E8F|nr:DUF4349 domain-containing protein [Mucilaginibacter phenanthrenivorans]MCR8558727.1 DUF4349 domain-containing protein [Mucilaginibacter phenanthrenivorans]
MKSKISITLMAGLFLLGACEGRRDKESADSTSVSTSKEKAVDLKKDTLKTGSKLVKKADIRFKVKNVQQTSEQIAALTTSLNGMVIHHTINSTSENSADIKRSSDSIMRVTVVNTTADMTVKIPPANLESFMLQVTRMGLYVENSHMDITDKSLDYLSTQMKLKNQSERVAKNKQDAATAKNPDDLLAFKNNMVDQQINNRRTDDSVKNSVVTLSFYESNVIHREIIANSDLSAYNPPAIKQLDMSFENGWGVFVSLLIALANAWVIFPIGFGVWMLVRYLKKKQPAALVKS